MTPTLLAFAGFPLGDAGIQSRTGNWPAQTVAGLCFSVGALVLAVILFCREGRCGFRINRSWLHIARRFTLFVGALTFFSAISTMPLADVDHSVT